MTKLTHAEYQEMQKQKLLREEHQAFVQKVKEVLKPLEEELENLKAELEALKKKKKDTK